METTTAEINARRHRNVHSACQSCAENPAVSQADSNHAVVVVDLFFAEFCGPVVVVAAAPGLPSLIDGVPTALCTA